MNVAGSGLRSGDLPRLLGKQLTAEAVAVSRGEEAWRGGRGRKGGVVRGKRAVAEGSRRAGLWSRLCYRHCDVGLPPVLETQPFCVHLPGCALDEQRSGGVPYL